MICSCCGKEKEVKEYALFKKQELQSTKMLCDGCAEKYKELTPHFVDMELKEKSEEREKDKIMEQEFVQMYKELREVFTPDEIKKMTEKIKKDSKEEVFHAGRQSGKTVMMREDMEKRMYDVIGEVKEDAKKEAAEYVEIVKKIANSPPPISQEVIDKLSKSQEEYEKGDTVYTKCDNDVKYIAVDFKTVTEINLKNENEKLKKKIRNQRTELRRLNRKIRDFKLTYDFIILTMKNGETIPPGSYTLFKLLNNYGGKNKCTTKL